MELTATLRGITDDQLLDRLKSLVEQSNRHEADLVAHIGEVDERRLYARFAFSSMFAYCTQALHLSEAVAYRRIAVARAARKCPVLLAMLREGRLHLTAAALLAPLLTDSNCESILARASHRSKREMEELVAQLSPRPDVAAAIRKLPDASRAPAQPKSGGSSAMACGVEDSGADTRGIPPPAELSPGRVAARPIDPLSPAIPSHGLEPLSPARYKVQFTASAELRDKLERLVALMRAEVPSGDIAQLIEQAVTEKLARLEAKRFGTTKAPRQKVQASMRKLPDTITAPTSRHVPAAVRRAVRERDGDRCRFVDEHGRRCSERSRLEFHHRRPFGMGGEHSLGNLSLLCSTHNRRMAEVDYGVAAIPRHRRQHARTE
jgi:hypothetical protein